MDIVVTILINANINILLTKFEMSQSSFEKLPVPNLRQTLDKYLESVRPLVTPNQYAKTVQLTNEFLTTEGPFLQAQLQDRALKTDNWLTEWWKETAYLANRMPLPVHVSPAAICDKLEFSSDSQMLNYTSLVIVEFVEFFQKVLSDKLPPDKLGGISLCMRQYKSLVGGHRIPGKVTDTQKYTPDSNHIIVVHKGHFFKLPVFGYRDGSRCILRSHEIKHLLSQIMDSSHLPSVPVGILSSQNRDDWYSAREELNKSSVNRYTLNVITSSLFLIELDEASNQGVDDEFKSGVIGDLRGDFKCYNRWYDVGMQLIITREGYAKYLLEHSLVDGPPSVVIANRGHYRGITDTVPDIPVNAKELPEIELLKWEISPLLHEYIQNAKVELIKLSEKIDFKLYTFSEFGKDFFKSYKLSPDSLVQLAIQLTFYKLHQHSTACYESVSTRRFYDGRTETLRSTSTESTEMVKAMLSPTRTEVKLGLLREFVKKHDENSRQAFNGQGIDRHLLGLKLIAKQENLNPEFFSDISFSKTNYFRVSTSQVPNPFLSFMGFGPVVEDGYGICYNPHESYFNLFLSSFTTCANTVSTDKLCRVIIESLKDVKKLVENLPLPGKL